MANDNAVLREDFNVSTVPNILRRIYKDEEILTVGARFEGRGKGVVDFLFPSYSRTRGVLDHVSAVSMSAAILEGCFCAAEDAFYSKMFPRNLDSDWFYDSMSANRWVLLSLNVLFRKQVRPGEIASLNFEVLDIGEQRLRSHRTSITISFKGFCAGETLNVIESRSH